MSSPRLLPVVLRLLGLAVILPAAAAPDPPPVLSLLQLTRPLVIAHRGDSAAAPENTLPAFAQALSAGADLVELDYHHSSDGVPVVIHDHTLDRTTDAVTRWRRREIRVDQTVAADLQTLDAGAWFSSGFSGTRVPLLTEALDAIRRGGPALIERKTGDAATCVRLLRECGLINRVVVQSFDWNFLRDVHALAPGQVLGALGPDWRDASLTEEQGRLGPDQVAAAASLGAKVIVWNRNITPAGIDTAQKLGLKVWVYTIDDPEHARALVTQGVNGIITNRPALLRAALGR